ncbi:HAD-IIB family hydrolase [Collinsella sp. AGMB00827]|uniref:HAD-IIB family hydrolase n=2 Tax=Collinsella ureilytica TaxID=2869515 RepID=A0ABS7MLZ3_9ACTN|nr:HAD-IIB family hydrolase [Collinsella urealyticum]
MDETFLDDSHCIPQENIEALRRMRELGVLFVPSSGRPYNSIMGNFEGVDPELLKDSYVISYNGGFINRFGDPEPLTSCAIDRKIAEELYALGLEHGFTMHVYKADGTIYVVDPVPSEWEYVRRLKGVERLDSTHEPDLSFTNPEGPVKLLYMSEDFEELKRLGSELVDDLARRGCSITYSSNRYIEFMPEGVDKGTGLAKLAEMLGIEVADTIGMGDSANDLEMIRAAGLGVGVANSAPDIVHECDVILKRSASEGALAEVVARFLEPR